MAVTLWHLNTAGARTCPGNDFLKLASGFKFQEVVLGKDVAVRIDLSKKNESTQLRSLSRINMCVFNRKACLK